MRAWQQSEEGKAYYVRYHVDNRERDNARTKRNKAVSRNWIDALKESTPCMDCGQFYPACVMDFDHRGDKVMSVGTMIGYRRERIEAEIAKCEIVCSNCHRMRTFM